MQSTTALLQARPMSLDELEREVVTSKTVARSLIVGLPLLGILASLFFGVPLFAALMSGCFLLATAYVCRQALVRFTGRTLRLLVAGRLVIALVVGAMLSCATGAAWAGMVSALLRWLTADRLLGRHALQDLSMSVRKPRRMRAAVPADVSDSPPLASAQQSQVSPRNDPAPDVGNDENAARLFPTTNGAVPLRRRGRCKS